MSRSRVEPLVPGRVLVVGAGTIGVGWATFFAARGVDVVLYDADSSAAERATARVREQLELLDRFRLLDPAPAARSESASEAVADRVERSLDRLVVTGDLAAGHAADYVQECAPERYEVKCEVFRQLDRLVGPAVPIASSTSGLLISEMQAVCTHPGRCLVAHPFNPPHLIPLVELVPGQKTAVHVVRQVAAMFAHFGKSPIVLNREVPGHVANRLAAALWREAIHLVDSGVASVEDVDLAVTAGLGPRWAVLGPHLTYHLGGGDGGLRTFWEHLGPAFSSYFADLSTATQLSPELLGKLESGLSAEVSGVSVSELARRRDERLIALLAALKAHRA